MSGLKISLQNEKILSGHFGRLEGIGPVCWVGIQKKDLEAIQSILESHSATQGERAMLELEEMQKKLVEGEERDVSGMELKCFK